MLDCESPDVDEVSSADSGGVSASELAVVQVLEREREAGPGRVKTGCADTK